MYQDLAAALSCRRAVSKFLMKLSSITEVKARLKGLFLSSAAKQAVKPFVSQGTQRCFAQMCLRAAIISISHRTFKQIEVSSVEQTVKLNPIRLPLYLRRQNHVCFVFDRQIVQLSRLIDLCILILEFFGMLPNSRQPIQYSAQDITYSTFISIK